MTEEKISKMRNVIIELEMALFWISKNTHPWGSGDIYTWKDLALKMAKVAREALESLDKGENR